jgi:molybdopterin molybdotransferase
MAQLTEDRFAFGGRLIPLSEASRLLSERFVCQTGVETLSLSRANARVLAQDVVSPIDVPMQTNSAVDGYAVHFEDLSPTEDTILPVKGRITAGHPMAVPLPRGYAARIFTGAVMPEGPDTVLMQEDCVATDADVRIRPGIKQGANRRLAGEDVKAHSVALKQGRRLGPPEIGLAASLGFSELPVRLRVRAALFSTGDEVAEPGQALKPGQIYDSNRAMIAHLLERANVCVTDGGILPDRPDRLEKAFKSASQNHDLIITSGGVSVGEEDHIRAVIEQLGELSFWRLGIKPGRPVAVGLIGSTPIIGLPGNPVAAMVTYMAVTRPLIAILGGETYRAPSRFPVRSAFAYRKKRDRREYVRVRLERIDSTLVAHRFPRDGAGVLSSLTESDALAELPESMTELQPGAWIDCIPLSMIYD